LSDREERELEGPAKRRRLFGKARGGLQILDGSLRLPLGPAKDLLQIVEEPPADLKVRDRIFGPLAPEDPVAGDPENPAHLRFGGKPFRRPREVYGAPLDEE